MSESSVQNQNSCLNSRPCHAAQGTGYCLGAACGGVTIAVVAAVVTTLVLGLLAGDIYFMYRVGVMNLKSLIWAVPLGIGFLVLDVFFAARIAACAGSGLKELGSCTKEFGKRGLGHFKNVVKVETSN